jgi:type II secretory ATPase GspE/PulE/Tfp pilus assembly ATPase PilB-like protein
MLVIGPTGSGKTTTLYAMLQHLQNDSLQIMTLEDPVEYALPGIRQTAVDPPRLDFANGIRAMMRQDPDVLLIGEIRDEETAAMALRAAQTGHRVFSTLHASCPFTALPRLQQLQISLQGLRGSLLGILSQRLIRQLCPACSIQKPASASDQALLSVSEPIPLSHPVGCPNCHGTGYRGRLPLLEVLPFPPSLEGLLDDRHRLGHSEIQQMATAAGWESLAAHGRQRVLAGQTSLAELLRTIDPASLQAQH